MRQIILTLIFCSTFFNLSFGQIAKRESPQTPQELYNFHISKKKTNTAAAFVALGGGLAMIAGGVSTNINKCLLSDCKNGMALVYSGIGVTLSSIYLFDRAGKHKKKATIQLRKGAVGFRNDVKYSGISVTVTF